MSGRIKKSHLVITTISLGDNYANYHPEITQGKWLNIIQLLMLLIHQMTTWLT